MTAPRLARRASRLLVAAAVVVVVGGLGPIAVAEDGGTATRTKFFAPNRPPQQGTWQPVCPQLSLPAQPGWEEQTSMKTMMPDGSVLGSAHLPRGGLFVLCAARGARPWKQTVSTGPVSVAVDRNGNIAYAGEAKDASGTFVVVGMLSRAGQRLWEQRVDGSGDESKPTVVVAGGGVFVFGEATGGFPGQAPQSKGHRFVARYDMAGRALWLLQSSDFGKPTTTEFDPNDKTPSAFSVDAYGNACVATTLVVDDSRTKPQTLGRLVKLDPNGATAWRTPIVMDVTKLAKGDLRHSEITDVTISEDAKSLFVIGHQAQGMRTIIVKVRGDGIPQWSQISAISFSEKSDDPSERWSADDWGSRGTAVRGSTLYALSAYHHSIVADGVKDYENTAAVAAYRVSDGKRLWVREYRSGQPSEILAAGFQILPSGNLAIAAYDENAASIFLVSDAKAARAAAPPKVIPTPQPAAAAPAAPVAASQPESSKSAPAAAAPASAPPQSRRERLKDTFRPKFPAPSGKYLARHKVWVHCDAEEECYEDGADVLVVKQLANEQLQIELETVGANFHECSFKGTLTPQGTNEWRSIPDPDSPECKVVLEQTKDAITMTASSCDYYCGARASLDSTFPRRRR